MLDDRLPQGPAGCDPTPAVDAAVYPGSERPNWGASFEAVRHFWAMRAARYPDGIPCCADLPFEEMSPWMPDAMVLDLDRRTFDFTFALVGTRVIQFYGREFTGRSLTTLDFPLGGENADLFWRWWWLTEYPMPAFDTARNALAAQYDVEIHRLILPLRGRAPGTMRLLAIQRLGRVIQHDRPAAELADVELRRRALPAPQRPLDRGWRERFLPPSARDRMIAMTLLKRARNT